MGRVIAEALKGSPRPTEKQITFHSTLGRLNHEAEQGSIYPMYGDAKLAYMTDRERIERLERKFVGLEMHAAAMVAEERDERIARFKEHNRYDNERHAKTFELIRGLERWRGTQSGVDIDFNRTLQELKRQVEVLERRLEGVPENLHTSIAQEQRLSERLTAVERRLNNIAGAAQWQPFKTEKPSYMAEVVYEHMKHGTWTMVDGETGTSDIPPEGMATDPKVGTLDRTDQSDSPQEGTFNPPEPGTAAADTIVELWTDLPHSDRAWVKHQLGLR